MATAAILTAANPLLQGLFGLIDDLFTTDEERSEAKLKLMELDSEGALAQLGVNSVEASHKSIFVAGWRPAVGWTCAFALAWTYVLYPMLSAAAVLAGLYFGVPFDVTLLPVLDLGQMMPVLMGMLGLGAMRSYEKVQGVASNSMKAP